MVQTNVSGSSKKKQTHGRQKIEIKKIENTNSRQVTFSKRRTGLFKKASEVCVLTGAQMAILVNSPGGRRVFAFGHPNADVLIDRYLNDNNTNTAGAVTQTSHQPPLPMTVFNQHYVEVSRELEAEKKRREMIPRRINNSKLPWYDESIDKLNVEELEQYLCSLEELKKKAMTRADELALIKKSQNVEMGSNNTVPVPAPLVDIPTDHTGDHDHFNLDDIEEEFWNSF